MKTALISGASRGMGAEFSQILSQKYNLVLVARNIAHLKKVKILCNKNSEILLVPLDLTKDTSVAELFDLLASKGIQVDILINNAGVGDYSAFEVSDLTKQKYMIDLNIRVLTEMTYIFLSHRNTNTECYLLNLGSVASFFPGPYLAVYFATKAYVLSFSQALMEELKNKNVSVTVFCPGPTKTNFSKTANLRFSNDIPSARESAEKGIEALFSKKRVAVPGFNNKLLSNLPRFLSRGIVRNLMGKRRRP